MNSSLGLFPAAASAQLPYLPHAFMSGHGSRQPNFGFENCEGGDPASHRINLAVPPFFQPLVRTRPQLWEGLDSDPNSSSTAGSMISPQFRLGRGQNQSTFESASRGILDSYLSTSCSLPGWLESVATPAVPATLSELSLPLSASVRFGDNSSSAVPGHAVSMRLCAAPSMQSSDSAVHPAGLNPAGILSSINHGDKAALAPALESPAGGETANERLEDSYDGHRMAVDTLIN